jgi:hypothetical protein
MMIFLRFCKQEKNNIIEYTNKGKVLRAYILICKRAILLSVLMMIVTCLHSWSTCWSLCNLGIDLIIITWCYAFSNDIDFLNIIQIGNASHLKGTKEMPKINAHVNFRKHECGFKVCHFHKLFNHLMEEWSWVNHMIPIVVKACVWHPH